MKFSLKLLLIITIVCCLIYLCDGKPKKKRAKRGSSILRKKETNAVEFIRLAVMRLIYGVATRVGLEEQISEALNGAFVPPGVEDEYGDAFELLNRDDDDDYDY